MGIGSLTRRELEARVGSVRDAFGPRAGVLEAGPGRGLRTLELTTGAGLEATFLVDRACDLYSLRWRGVPLGFHGAPGAGDAAFYRSEGRGWLETFSGFMVTCGLRNVGPPSGGEGMHGGIAHRRADELSVTSAWEGDGFCTTITSRHREAAILSRNLELKRTWRVRLGEPELVMQDEITNLSFRDEHMLLLYHLNAGYPLLAADTTLAIDAEPVPRDADAETGLDAWMTMREPAVPFPEQVFFFEGASSAAVESAELGCRLRLDWDAEQLPFATAWKDLESGTYGLGVEPGTCHPLGREEVLASGQGRILSAGATFTAKVHIAVDPL